MSSEFNSPIKYVATGYDLVIQQHGLGDYSFNTVEVKKNLHTIIRNPVDELKIKSISSICINSIR